MVARANCCEPYAASRTRVASVTRPHYERRRRHRRPAPSRGTTTIRGVLLFWKKKPTNAQYLRATPRSPRNQSGRPVRRVRYRRPLCSPAFHGVTTTARYVLRPMSVVVRVYTLYLCYFSRAVYCSHRSSAVRACAPTKNPNRPCGVIATAERYTSVRPIGRGARSGRAATNTDGIWRRYDLSVSCSPKSWRTGERRRYG